MTGCNIEADYSLFFKQQEADARLKEMESRGGKGQSKICSEKKGEIIFLPHGSTDAKACVEGEMQDWNREETGDHSQPGKAQRISSLG